MSILEEVLLEEYDRSLRISRSIEEALAVLPKGYVRERVVNGRCYYYLQRREGSRVLSEYVPAARADDVKAQVGRRKELEQALREQARTRRQIERALGKELIGERARS